MIHADHRRDQSNFSDYNLSGLLTATLPQRSHYEECRSQLLRCFSKMGRSTSGSPSRHGTTQQRRPAGYRKGPTRRGKNNGVTLISSHASLQRWTYARSPIRAPLRTFPVVTRVAHSAKLNHRFFQGFSGGVLGAECRRVHWFKSMETPAERHSDGRHGVYRTIFRRHRTLRL